MNYKQQIMAGSSVIGTCFMLMSLWKGGIYYGKSTFCDL